jgi:multiple sugar transport system ATP-binding protein
MAALEFKNLSKLYKGGAVGVRDLNIEVLEGELMVLVGPSGSGKSTTLRLAAGLETPTAGEVYIGGKLANDIAPRDRDIAMVFQDYALYPHLNVEQNLGFGLRMRGAGKGETRERVMRASQMLGIDSLLRRKPRELSGGQRQRVALGRALVRDPKVFLFDEPLSNLDAALRVQLRREIKDIHRTLGATMIYVTHDQGEAMAIGRRIAVMNDGAVEQVCRAVLRQSTDESGRMPRGSGAGRTGGRVRRRQPVFQDGARSSKRRLAEGLARLSARGHHAWRCF